MERTLTDSSCRSIDVSSAKIEYDDVAAQQETLEVLGRAIEEEKRILERHCIVNASGPRGTQQVSARNGHRRSKIC